MRRLAISVCLGLLGVAACARPKPTTPSAATDGTAVAQSQSQSQATPPLPDVQAQPAQSAAATVDKAAAASALPRESNASDSGSAKAKSPGASSSLQPHSAPTTQPVRQATVAGTPEEPPLPSTLDLASLEQRLRDTRAIGVLTKLSLKNQVDDLLNQFRSFYRGERKTSLAELRQRYDLLLLKVLTLLQDGDAPLAMAISSSREAIWGILADPEKFAKI